MNHDKMSPFDQFALCIIRNTGCISFQQLSTIMLQMNPNYNPRVTESFLHRLEAYRDVKISADGTYVTDSTWWDNTLDRKTIMAISVAMKFIEDPKDYSTMEKGLSGADLKFYSGGVNYAVIVNDGTDLAKVSFMENKYAEWSNKIKKWTYKDASVDDILDAYQTLLITYPAQATSGSEKKMKKFVEEIRVLDLTMPHAICFLKDKDIFHSTEVIASEPVDRR